MLKKDAENMLMGLAERLENRVRDWTGIEVQANIIRCHNNGDSYHLQILDEDGAEICQFHVWDPWDDYPEHLYEEAFYVISVGIRRTLEAWEEFQRLMATEQPFGFTGAPSHGGIWN